MSDEIPLMHCAKVESFVKGHRQLLAVRVAHDGKSVFPEHYTVRPLDALKSAMEKMTDQLTGPGKAANVPASADPAKPPGGPDGGIPPYAPPRKN